VTRLSAGHGRRRRRRDPSATAVWVETVATTVLAAIATPAHGHQALLDGRLEWPGLAPYSGARHGASQAPAHGRVCADGAMTDRASSPRPPTSHMGPAAPIFWHIARGAATDAITPERPPARVLERSSRTAADAVSSPLPLLGPPSGDLGLLEGPAASATGPGTPPWPVRSPLSFTAAIVLTPVVLRFTHAPLSSAGPTRRRRPDPPCLRGALLSVFSLCGIRRNPSDDLWAAPPRQRERRPPPWPYLCRILVSAGSVFSSTLTSGRVRSQADSVDR